MLLLAGTITFSALNGSFSTDTWFVPLLIGMVLGYSTVGALLASRNPGNPIGWLLLTVGLCFVIGSFCEEYVSFAYLTKAGSVRGGVVAAWVWNWIYVPMLASLPLLGLLFPTGRVPGPRWRFLVPATIAVAALAVLGSILSPGPIDVDVDPSVRILNPTGVQGFPGPALAGLGWFGFFGAWVAAVAAVVVRYRRSAGEEKQQIRWLAYVVVTAAAIVLVGVATAVSVGESFGDSVVGQLFIGTGFALFGIGIPAAMGVAILKYRLYDLDLVIKKTVVFAILVIVSMTLGGSVLLLVGGSLVGLPSGEQTAILLAGIVLGLVAIPLYRLSTRIADRVVYGGRARPYEVLTEFSDRVAGSYSTEDVLPRMAQILGQGTGAEAARVWVLVGGSLRPTASWPKPEAGTPLPIGGDALPPMPDRESAFEVRHQGELLGALSITNRASDPMNPSKERLVRDLASQAGLVLRNVRLIEELRASRQRLVAAQDEERRRLERNIHDGAQQQLVALRVKLRLAEQLTDRDAAKAKELLAQLQTETGTALDDLRDLARGIYPPLLADQGLGAALESQARKSPVPVTVQTDGVARYPQDVEAAVYFCALEALNNLAKYAEASRATVSLAQSDGMLRFAISDDGVGFDTARTSKGTGLQGMADRIDAIGGSLEVRSAPGEGTTVLGRVQVER
jgi:signal transduction histidine kinase